MVDVKKGPLTRDELLTLWQSVTDREYNRPLLEQPESQIAAVEQAAEQFATVSGQVDRNTQAMFILPWSGQTAPPASGPAHARTVLQLQRGGAFDVALVFRAGDLLVEHHELDYGREGPVDVTTGRLFLVEETAVLCPGNPGPVDLPVVAINPGAGYNHCLPNTLTRLAQPGAGFNNAGATVQNGGGQTNRIFTAITPDVPIAQHVGQYLYLNGGANAGRYLRIIGVEPPTDAHGGVFNVAAEALLNDSGVTGGFVYGERITQPLSGAEVIFLGAFGNKFLVLRRFGTLTLDPIQGDNGGTASIVSKEWSEQLIPEVETCSWQVVRWHEELSITLLNPNSPSGGVAGTLDEIGAERNLPRQFGELDEAYRQRISVPADVVSPAAVLRKSNAILVEIGESACLREVGRPLFPGLFFDADDEAPFAFDLDLVPMTIGGVNNLRPGELVFAVDADGRHTTGIAHFDQPSAPAGSPLPARVFAGVARVSGPGFAPGQTLVGKQFGSMNPILSVGAGLQPHHRFNVLLNLREFRGFFMVGVPRVYLDDYGTFYDAPIDSNAYDAVDIDNFYDGAALGTLSMYARLYNTINATRPAGVPFDLYIEELSCI